MGGMTEGVDSERKEWKNSVTQQRKQKGSGVLRSILNSMCVCVCMCESVGSKVERGHDKDIAVQNREGDKDVCGSAGG